MHLLQDTAMPCALPDDAAASTMTGFWIPWDLFVQDFHCSIIVRNEEYTIPKSDMFRYSVSLWICLNHCYA
jgi:hypothetical protein